MIGPIAETIVRDATLSLHKALARASVAHTLEIITPGNTPYGYCLADHSVPCMTSELAKALPLVRGALAAAQ